MLIVSVYRLVTLRKLVKQGQCIHSFYMKDWLIDILPIISLVVSMVIILIVLDELYDIIKEKNDALRSMQNMRMHRHRPLSQPDTW